MRFPILVCGVLLLQTVSLPVASSTDRETCVDASKTASALTKVRERGWTAWTPNGLAKTWPSSLTRQDCRSSQGTCTLLGHRGGEQGGAGPCYCCETFEFSSDRAGGSEERLSAVTLYYSSAQYADVLAAARQLAGALGLARSNDRVGQKQPPNETLMQRFDWDEPSLNKRAVMDVQVSHDKLWTVFVRIGWYGG
jgi:hypothetical protein